MACHTFLSSSAKNYDVIKNICVFVYTLSVVTFFCKPAHCTGQTLHKKLLLGKPSS